VALPSDASRLPSADDSLDRHTAAWPMSPLPRQRAEPLSDPTRRPPQQLTSRHPAVVARWRSTGPVADCHGGIRTPDQPAPSGLRVGTPDRRGKRGEVAAIFVIITTEPPWSIG